MHCIISTLCLNWTSFHFQSKHSVHFRKHICYKQTCLRMHTRVKFCSQMSMLEFHWNQQKKHFNLMENFYIQKSVLFHKISSERYNWKTVLSNAQGTGTSIDQDPSHSPLRVTQWFKQMHSANLYPFSLPTICLIQSNKHKNTSKKVTIS